MSSLEELRPAVMAVFLNDLEQILIGSSPRDGGYKIPQGGLDAGETPEAAVIREVKEELGLSLSHSDIIMKGSDEVFYLYPPEEPLRNSYKGQRFHVFLIRFRETMDPHPQDDEFDRLLWIAPGDLDSYDTRHREEAYKKALQSLKLL